MAYQKAVTADHLLLALTDVVALPSTQQSLGEASGSQLRARSASHNQPHHSLGAAVEKTQSDHPKRLTLLVTC